ncbi:MAG: DUF975 family protein [Oscillospiraceae bacterium]|nr:DUF975 family protein [Oscillospiraceae bacterium]MBQ9332432.1 DUF975 family protein [Oscillospiraceae bacterium]
MIIDRTAAKLQAKQLIRESQPSMLTAALLYTLLTALIGWLSLRLTGVDTNTMNEMLQLASEGNSEAVMELMTKATPSAGASLIDSLLRLAMAVVGVGFSLFVMNSVRRSQPALGNLLDGFGMFPRVLFLIILQIVLIFLWSLLLVIPGIIAAYRYSFAVYVMIDHPEMSAMDCLRESKRLTTGYKRQLFLLDLSFIFWFLLTMIPVVGYIAQVYVTPYMESARVLYYEQIRALQGGSTAV